MLTSLKSTFPGVTNEVIAKYFDSINSSDYQTTAEMFEAQGRLYPPFQKPITGREAIANYLQNEAVGMRLEPNSESIESLGGGLTQILVQGLVQTPLFVVNVSWRFILNDDQQIMAVKVDLLASALELLNLREKRLAN